MQQKSIVAILVALVVILAGTTIYFAVSKNAYAPSAYQNVPAKSVESKTPITQNGSEDQVVSQSNTQTTNQIQNKKPFFSFKQKGSLDCKDGIVPENGKGKAEMIIKKDGQNSGTFFVNGICATGGYKILARNDQYLYFSVRPDELGGLYVHDYAYPNLFRLNISDNSVEQLLKLDNLTTIAVSSDGNYAVYWYPRAYDNYKDWKIVVMDLEKKVSKNYATPLKDQNFSYGDYIFSPSNEKLAVGAINRDKAATDTPSSMKNTFYVLDLAKGAYEKFDSSKKQIYPWINEDYSDFNSIDLNVGNE